jgi:uncharacterized membrane protein
VIDRGLKNATQLETWCEICQSIVSKLAQKQYLFAVRSGIEEIGKVLDQYYVNNDSADQNELPNAPIILN